MLAAELDGARFDQRFAGRAFVATLLRRDMDPWRAFIRSTYGGPVEGELLSAAIAGSLDCMRTQQGTLRAFLLDAVLEGRSFAQSSSPAVEALLTETETETGTARASPVVLRGKLGPVDRSRPGRPAVGSSPELDLPIACQPVHRQRPRGRTCDASPRLRLPLVAWVSRGRARQTNPVIRRLRFMTHDRVAVVTVS